MRLRLSMFERYIAGTMLKATGMTLVVLVSLLVFFTLIDEMGDVGRGAYRTADALLVTLLAAPRYIFEAFPVAALLGSLIGLGSMGAHGELVAMRGAGFSLRQIILAVMKTGLLMVVGVLLFGELVAPAAEQWSERHRVEKLEQKVTLKTRYGFWARDGSAFVNIRGIEPGGRLEDIYIYEFDDQRRLTLATHAAGAAHTGDRWRLAGIRQSRVSVEGVERRELAQAGWDSLLDPGLLRVVSVAPAALSMTELFRYIRVMRQNGQSATDYEVAFWVKLATPLATLVMLFIAVPFVLAHQRFVSIGQRVFLGVLLGMAFYTLSRGMSYVAVVYALSPLLSALLPAAAFLAIGVYLMRRVH